MTHCAAAFPRRSILWILWMLCLLPADGADGHRLFVEDFDESPGQRWQQVKFEELTDYQVVTVNSNPCLQASANGTASAFALKLDLPPAPGMTLRWRWKISGRPTNGTEDTAATFDHTGRIFVAFDTWVGPPRTINYVWANRAALESTFEHPLTSRSKFLVVEQGDDKAGQSWTELSSSRTGCIVALTSRCSQVRVSREWRAGSLSMTPRRRRRAARSLSWRVARQRAASKAMDLPDPVRQRQNTGWTLKPRQSVIESAQRDEADNTGSRPCLNCRVALCPS